MIIRSGHLTVFRTSWNVWVASCKYCEKKWMTLSVLSLIYLLRSHSQFSLWRKERKSVKPSHSNVFFFKYYDTIITDLKMYLRIYSHNCSSTLCSETLKSQLPGESNPFISTVLSCRVLTFSAPQGSLTLLLSTSVQTAPMNLFSLKVCIFYSHYSSRDAVLQLCCYSTVE